MKQFNRVLVNTLIANVTTSFLWFALTFWVYLETRSVLATALTGGAYMLLLSFCAIPFGTLVDHHHKLRVMRVASVVTLVAFAAAGFCYLRVPHDRLLHLGGLWFWLFAGLILVGAVVESMRNIALSTVVTILVPEDRRANANGVVGTVQGLAFIVTSVFSGLAIGLLGMGWTLVIAIILTAVSLVHLGFVRIPEPEIVQDPGRSKVDLAGSIAAVRAIPGLFALIIFSTFNNLIGGVYMALMDPYGLTLFDVKAWGIWFGVCSTGFIVGGLLIARFGLGPNPMRTMLLVVLVMGAIGSLFTIREWGWLYLVGIWLYMGLVPAVEAAEQTVIQGVVPLNRQGRVFGFAQAFEMAAAPVTSFLIGPIAEFGILPWSRSESGRAALGWLLGDGQVRGIAVVFFVAGLVLIAAGLAAFRTRAYARLSAEYTQDRTPVEVAA